MTTVKETMTRMTDKGSGGNTVVGGKASPDAGPPSISEKDVRETLTADVAVVGSGIAGLTAALSAAEAGARTVLLEKSPSFNNRGLHNAALASRLQKRAGIEIDKDRVISTIMEFGAYRSDQRLVKLWADHCDRVMDWLLDMAEKEGIEVILDPTTKPWYFPNYPLIHVFRPKNQETLAEMLLKNAERLGVDFRFKTPAVRLEREGKGRVTGLIARDSHGDLIRVNASRGVVLCTGDYGNDRTMVERYCWPSVAGLPCVYEPAVNTGDGHKMGIWVGAAMDDPPHCAMLFDFAVFSKAGLFNLARQPWLYVNVKGERFMNEDLPWGYECAQIMQQEGGFVWSVWDGEYDREWPKMQSQCCKNMGPPTYLWDPKQLEEALENGNMIRARTIEELARQMKVPVETFKATTDRYNDLARKGKDADFGKHPDRLTTIDHPNFYACRMEARYMVILGGLKVNTSLEVLDREKKAIPGLYAAGNVSGSFFGNMYPTTAPGLTHSRAWTFGRLAGINAASRPL